MLRRLGGRLNPDVPGSGKAPALVASAARIKRSRFTKMGAKPPALPWQEEAWAFYDTVGELRSSANWKAASLSRVKLFIAEGDTDVPEPVKVDEGPAVDYLKALFNGPAGQSQMLGAIGLHFTVPGELYLVSFTDPETQEVEWVTASNKELMKEGTELVLDRGDGNKITLTDDDWILRIWKSHPKQHWMADSPTRAVLPVLRELEGHGKRVTASGDSRLAGNGVLLLPQELDFPKPENEELHDDPLMGMFIEAMVTPIQDRDSAAAIVPIILRAPGEHLKDAKWLYPDSKLDEQIDPMRDKALRRIAIGMDMPQEALLGMGGANHWSAWLITEEGVKLYVEPDVATICDALTTGYLWPLLEQDIGPERARDFTIWYDTGGLTERPDRGPDADLVFAAGELSGAALRKYRGFGDDDAPSDAERRERILLRLVERASPEVALQILENLGYIRPGEIQATPDGEPARVPSQRGDEPPALPPADRDRTVPDDPDETPPEDDAQAAVRLRSLAAGSTATESGTPACVIDVCHFAVLRTLDWAGKRLLKRNRSNIAQYKHVAPKDLHTEYRVFDDETASYALDNGAGWTLLVEALPEYEPLVPALDRYVRQLILAGEPHKREYLAPALRQVAHA